MRNIVLHPFEGQHVGQREDGYIDAAALCRANRKLIGLYFANRHTRAFLSGLSSELGIAGSRLIDVRRGGPSHERGTWVHPLVANHLGQWCSPRAAVFVVKLLYPSPTVQRVEVPTISGHELRLRILEQAERVFSLRGPMDASDRLLLQDRVRHFLSNHSTRTVGVRFTVQ